MLEVEDDADDLGEIEDRSGELLDAELSEPDHACGFVPPSDPVFHDPPVDCTENQDTGYSSGNAFEITVVMVDGKPVEKQTANAFWVMREAAKADGIDIHINSGFRTMSEQEYFYMCYTCCCCNNCNLAAQPGYSNHQSGHALDLNTATAGVYGWLAANAGAYGFSETVPSENWHWEWWGGGPGGGICDIKSPPTGNVDAVSCETIEGWAQDPEAPDTPVEVHVYFDGQPGDLEAIDLTLTADLERPDLCDAIGSCNHGFELELPLGLRDGQPHSVLAYVDDADGEWATPLVVDPPTLSCPAPALPEGIRRAVSDVSSGNAWRFSTVWDLVHTDPTTLSQIDEGPPLGAEPVLATDAAGESVWLLDAGFRRPIPTPEVAEAWRFHLASATVLGDEQLDELPEGTPVRTAPLLATDDGDRFWLIDDPRGGSPGGGSGDGGDAGDGSSDASGGDGSDTGALPDMHDTDDSGCACGAQPLQAPRSPWQLLAMMTLGLFTRRAARQPRP